MSSNDGAYWNNKDRFVNFRFGRRCWNVYLGQDVAHWSYSIEHLTSGGGWNFSDIEGQAHQLAPWVFLEW